MEQAQSVWDSVVHFGGWGHRKSMTVLQVWLVVPWQGDPLLFAHDLS